MITYSTTELADLTGATFRQIDYWAHRGLIRDVTGAAGAGNHRRWTRTDVERIRRVMERLDWGLTLDAAWRAEDPGPVPPPARVDAGLNRG